MKKINLLRFHLPFFSGALAAIFNVLAAFGIVPIGITVLFDVVFFGANGARRAVNAARIMADKEDEKLSPFESFCDEALFSLPMIWGVSVAVMIIAAIL